MYILETCSVLYFVATSSVPYLYASFIPHLHISHTTIPYSASSFVSCTYHVPRAAWSTTYNIHTFSLNLSSRMCTKSSRNPILIALRTTNQHGPKTRSIPHIPASTSGLLYSYMYSEQLLFWRFSRDGQLLEATQQQAKTNGIKRCGPTEIAHVYLYMNIYICICGLTKYHICNSVGWAYRRNELMFIMHFWSAVNDPIVAHTFCSTGCAAQINTQM